MISQIIWFLSWPLLIVVSFLAIEKMLKKFDQNQEK
jgi:hypothetical protein